MAEILNQIVRRGGVVLESEFFQDSASESFAFTVVFEAAGEIWVADGSESGVKIQTVADKAIELLD